MTLRDYLRIIRDRIVLVCVTVGIVTASTLAFSFRQVPEFSTSARLRVQPVGAGTEVADVLDQLLRTQNTVMTEAELVRSTDVAKTVTAKLGLSIAPEKLLESVEVTVVPLTEVLKITARSTAPQIAKALADAFADGYITQRRERAIQDATTLSGRVGERLKDAQDQLRTLDRDLSRVQPQSTEFQLKSRDRDRLVALTAVLQSQYQALLDRGTLRMGAGEIIEPAPLPESPSSPNHVRNAIFGLLISLPLAVGLTLLRDSLSDTVKSKEEAEHLTAAPTLALIPHDPKWQDPAAAHLASRDDPGSEVAEAYRTLRLNLEFSHKERARWILVTSPGRGEAKSATAANLAFAFAEAGRLTVLASADLRNPRLHDFVGTELSPGLSDAIRDPGRGSDWLWTISPNLWFLPSGAPVQPQSVRLGSRELESLFGRPGPAPSRARGRRNGAPARAPTRVARTTDVALLDAPPILRAAEVTALATAVDGVLLVLYAGVTRRAAAARAAEQIRKVGGRILGVVLVGVHPDDDSGRETLGSRRATELVSRAWERVLEGLHR